MATAIARIGREKRLQTLVQNIFVIEGPNKAVDQRLAERALLRANPWLADPEAFKAGAMVLVPSDTGLTMSERVERPGADLQGLLQEVTQRLQMSRSVVRQGVAKSDERRRAALEKLGNPNFIGELKKNSPEAAKLVPSLTDNLKRQADEEQKREAAFETAIEAAVLEIDRLRKLAQ
jgi:hypothetical protein